MLTGIDAGKPVALLFTKPVPEFLGVDLVSYGPFEDGCNALIPARIASILLVRDVALKVVEKND